MKKHNFYLVLALIFLLTDSPLVWAESAESGASTSQQISDDKSHNAWIKRELARRKKGLSLLRKVKDEASVSSTVEQFIEIWGLEGTEGQENWFISEKVTFADPAPQSLDGETLYKKAGKKFLKISDDADKALNKIYKRDLMTKELRAASTLLFYAWDK